MSLLILLSLVAAPQAPTPAVAKDTNAPKITIVSPVKGDKMPAVTEVTGPKVIRFAARVEAKDKQWKPDILIFKVTGDKKPTDEYGSYAIKVDPQQSDGLHVLEGDLKFAHLPPGRYLVKVRLLKGSDKKYESDGQYLYITE